MARRGQDGQLAAAQIDGGARLEPFGDPKRRRPPPVDKSQIFVAARREYPAGNIGPRLRQIDHGDAVEGSDPTQMIEMQMRNHHRHRQVGDEVHHAADVARARTGVEQQRAIPAEDQIGVILLIIARLADGVGARAKILHGEIIIDHAPPHKLHRRRIDNPMRLQPGRQFRENIGCEEGRYCRVHKRDDGENKDGPLHPG